MSLTIPVSQDQLTRQERLLVWIRRTGKNGAALGRFAGVSIITSCRWLKAESLPWHKVQVLREFGIPEDLLPVAVRKHGRQSAPPASAAPAAQVEA